MSELHDETEPTLDDKVDALLEGLQALVIVNMRLYDVQFAMLKLRDPELAQIVIEAHDNGKTLGPWPWHEGSE